LKEKKERKYFKKFEAIKRHYTSEWKVRGNWNIPAFRVRRFQQRNRAIRFQNLTLTKWPYLRERVLWRERKARLPGLAKER